MYKYFAGIETIEELRKRYRELLKKHHPDNENGSAEITKEINAEYGTLYSILRQKESSDKESCTEQDSSADEVFRAVLEKIINYDMDIQIIGEWIWAFNSFAYKDRLKELGFRYAPRKRAWTWHSKEYHKFHKKEIPLSHIKAKYGCQTVRSQHRQYSLD